MAAPVSFDLPCEIDPALAGDQGNTPYNSCDQLLANAEAHIGLRIQTGASTYGGYYSLQSSDLSDVVSNASEKLLEVNAHFIRARMVVDERAAEIERLRELVASQTKEKNDLKMQVRTLKEALRLFAKDYHSNKHASGRGFSSTTSEKALTVESEPTT
ncbi:hypothetical protein EDB92DRAFT_2117063 [Lactarius akahatsu]|uniref:Uncharacterized protein n=1 Tax=Lactarius akahatsu TaxID=416441 RepID=A0AAD4LB91_9AGAM|nr:hypothetical protein EDB92DRAFT_2117063 [Lactarius akahatsu]